MPELSNAIHCEFLSASRDLKYHVHFSQFFTKNEHGECRGAASFREGVRIPKESATHCREVRVQRPSASSGWGVFGTGCGSQVVVLVKSDPSFAAIFQEGTLVVGAAVSGTVFG
jgi:hypothetical protein